MSCPVGWVLLDLLKSEQDRIGRRLAFLEAQIEAGDMEYELASAHLDDCLALARDCHKLYMSIDDSLQRITNQAFFDHGVQTIAARHEGRAAEARSQTGNVAGLSGDLLVARAGIEPATFRFSGGRSYQLSYLALRPPAHPVITECAGCLWRP